MTGPSTGRKKTARIPGALLVAIALAGTLIWWLNRDKTPRFAGQSLLLITLDTTRADRLGAYGYEKAQTPVLDKLAKQGWLFERAMSHVPLTLPSHCSIMTGLLPIGHQVRDNGSQFLSDQFQTLAEAFRAKGYRTAAFAASFVVASKWGLGQGFDQYDEDFERGRSAHQISTLHAERPAREIADRAISWLATAEAPFFGWIHFYDPHFPFQPPEDLASQFAQDPYSGEIAEVDRQLGRILQQLEKKGLSEKTVLIVTGDHGEGLGEHQEQTHSVFIYNSTLRVPLIARLPGLEAEKGKRIQSWVSHVDLYPTFVDWFGLQAPLELHGRSLEPLFLGEELPPAPVYAESLYARYHYGWAELRAVIDGDLKLVDAPKPEIYDLSSSWSETQNLAPSRPDLVSKLRAKLKWIDETRTIEGVDSEGELDAESSARLRALGYVTARVDAPPSNIDPKDRRHLLQSLNETSHLLETGQNEQALALSRQILSEDPGLIDAHVLTALSLGRLYRFSECLDALRDALKLKPDSQELLFQLGICHHGAGEISEAKTLLSTLLEKDPTHHLARVQLAQVLQETGDQEAAEKLAREILAEDPGESAAHMVLGLGHLQRQEMEKAEAALKKAVELEPERPGLHYNLARLAEMQGQPELAAELYLKEVRIDETNHQAWQNFGILLGELGRHSEQIGAFRNLLRHTPDSAQAHFLLAQALLLAQRLDQEGFEHLCTAIRLDPQLARAYLLRALYREKLGHPLEAESDRLMFEHLHQKKSGSPPFPPGTSVVHLSTPPAFGQHQENTPVLLAGLKVGQVVRHHGQDLLLSLSNELMPLDPRLQMRGSDNTSELLLIAPPEIIDALSQDNSP